MEKKLGELKEFISVFCSYKKDKITTNKSLDDLGMYGDDKRDFLMSFIEVFHIDDSRLNHDKFCEIERFNPIEFFLFNEKDIKKIKITIDHLLNVIKKKNGLTHQLSAFLRLVLVFLALKFVYKLPRKAYYLKVEKNV